MNYDSERKRLIEEDSQFVSFPQPNYSKMTNEQIKNRTEMLKQTFEWAYSEDGEGELDEDI